MRGVVARFDPVAGLGELRADDGRMVPFHCIGIADGTRTIPEGIAVEFELLPKLGRYEGTRIVPV